MAAVVHKASEGTAAITGNFLAVARVNQTKSINSLAQRRYSAVRSNLAERQCNTKLGEACEIQRVAYLVAACALSG